MASRCNSTHIQKRNRDRRRNSNSTVAISLGYPCHWYPGLFNFMAHLMRTKDRQSFTIPQAVGTLSFLSKPEPLTQNPELTGG